MQKIVLRNKPMTTSIFLQQAPDVNRPSAGWSFGQVKPVEAVLCGTGGKLTTPLPSLASSRTLEAKFCIILQAVVSSVLQSCVDRIGWCGWVSAQDGVENARGV